MNLWIKFKESVKFDETLSESFSANALTIMEGQIDIILVEDDLDDAHYTMKVLKRHLINEIIHLCDGEEAVNFLLSSAQNASKLVLLDLRLPKVDGIEILRMIRNNALNSLKVIGLLSFPEAKIYINSQGLEADGYLQKPLKFEEFIRLVSGLNLTPLLVK